MSPDTNVIPQELAASDFEYGIALSGLGHIADPHRTGMTHAEARSVTTTYD